MPSPQEVICLHNVRFSWPGQRQPTLDIPSLKVTKGEHLFIQGASGSGKTTLLNLLTGINQADEGSVRVLDHSLTEMGNRRRDQFRVDHIGVIFQQFNLLPYLSVFENVLLPCWFSSLRRERSHSPEQSAKQLLNHLNLLEASHNQSVQALSTGQQQRVAVARALIGKPEIVIADEPTSALDADNRDRFIELMFSEAHQQGSTLIFVSHDTHLAKHFTRVIELAEINQAA